MSTAIREVMGAARWVVGWAANWEGAMAVAVLVTLPSAVGRVAMRWSVDSWEAVGGGVRLMGAAWRGAPGETEAAGHALQ